MTGSFRTLSSIAMIAAFAMVPTKASAQGWPALDDGRVKLQRDGTRDAAVLIAIEDYDVLADIPGAVANLNAWEAHLRDRGVPPESISTLTNAKATRENIKQALERSLERVGDEGRLWFVFIGHGTPVSAGDGGEMTGALVGADARSDEVSVEARSFRRDELLELLGRGAHTQSILVLDACFSGRSSGGDMLIEGTQFSVPVSDVADELGAESGRSDAPEVLVFSAAGAGEYAGGLPGARRPAFSYLLLGALRGWAAGDDSNVSAQEAVDFVGARLRLIAGRNQTPELAGSGAVLLSRGARESDPDTIGLITSVASPEEIEKRQRVRRSVMGAGLGIGLLGGAIIGTGYGVAVSAGGRAEASQVERDAIQERGNKLVIAGDVVAAVGVATLAVGWMLPSLEPEIALETRRDRDVFVRVVPGLSSIGVNVEF